MPVFDPYLGATGLLLPLDGGDDGTTFTDSARAKSVTRSGTTVTKTATKKFGTASGYFNGSSSLTTANHADFQFGAGDFTVEAWVNFAALPTAGNSMYLVNRYNLAADQRSWGISLINQAGVYSLRVPLSTAGTSGSTTVAVEATWQPTLGVWYHIAASRSAGTIYLFIDGAVAASAANTTNCFVGTATLRVGATDDPISYFNGYIDDVRITKGVGRYTAAFSVPTEAHPVAGTVLLLNMNGTDASTTFSDVEQHTVTPSGNAQVDTAQKKFGTASGLFDGAGDYLSIADSNEFEFGADDFTIEAQIRLSGYSADFSGAYIGNIVSKSASWQAFVQGTASSWTTVGLGIYDTQWNYVTGSYAFALNTWYHLAWVRTAGSTVLFVNGVPVTALTALAQTAADNANAVTVGGWTVSGAEYYFPGWIDDLRITKGTARYAAPFLAPTAEATPLLDPEVALTFPTPTTSIAGLTGETGSVAATAPIPATAFSVLLGQVGIAAIRLLPPVLAAEFLENVFPVAISAPPPTMASAGSAGEVITFAESAPMPTLEIGTKDMMLSAPIPIMNAVAYAGSIITVTAGATTPILSATTDNPAVITAANTAALPQLSAALAAGRIFEAVLAARPPVLDAQILTGEVATMLAQAATPIMEASGHPAYTITFACTAPVPQINAVLQSALAAAYRTWALNLRKGALTEYDNFEFNSYAVFNGKVLGASAAGVSELGTQNADNSTAIDATITTGQDSFESSFHKRVPRIYVGCKTTGDLHFSTITTEGGTRTYALPYNGVTGIQQRRVPIGKGPRSRLWQFTVTNVDGADFVINDILVQVSSLRRRVM